MTALGHSRRFGIGRESACLPIPDIPGGLFIRRVVPTFLIQFAERTLWNIRPALFGHSDLRPANFTTFAHFSVSSTMNFPKSAGVMGIGTPPTSASRALILGSARPALNSLLSLSTISAGVPFGAPTPYQVLAS